MDRGAYLRAVSKVSEPRWMTDMIVVVVDYDYDYDNNSKTKGISS
jgi:hypothetical protein